MEAKNKASLYSRQYYRRYDAAPLIPIDTAPAGILTHFDKAGKPVVRSKPIIVKRFAADMVRGDQRFTVPVSAPSVEDAIQLALAEESRFRKSDPAVKLDSIILGNRKVWSRQ